MKSSTKILISVVAVVLIIGFMLIGTYNSLVSLQTDVEQKKSNITVQMKRRIDLIPNVVEVVKGYAAHEKGVFDDVAKARAAMIGAKTPQQEIDSNSQMTSALGRLFAIAEAYPQLKANENFKMLQDQLEGTENRIAVARGNFNTAAASYNKKIRSFPTNIFAGMFGFEKAELYDAKVSEDAPNVSFK